MTTATGCHRIGFTVYDSLIRPLLSRASDPYVVLTFDRSQNVRRASRSSISAVNGLPGMIPFIQVSGPCTICPIYDTLRRRAHKNQGRRLITRGMEVGVTTKP